MIRYVRLMSGLFLLLICTPLWANSTIISTNSFVHIQQLLLKNKQSHHVLLAIDDDDTLTMVPCTSSSHCQYLGGPAWFSWQAKLPKNNPNRIWSNFSELLNIQNLLFMINKMVLDDPAIPSTLKTAKKLGVHVIVASARGYRMEGPTEMQLEHDHIMSLIEKTALMSPSRHISLPGFYFPTPWNQNPTRRAAYLHGVLYAAGQNKGHMLKDLLHRLHQTQKIKTIIFVDDTFRNVKDIATAYRQNKKVNVIAVYFTRLKAHKAAFLTGKNAKKLQFIANQQWYAIRDSLRKNLVGFTL